MKKLLILALVALALMLAGLVPALAGGVPGIEPATVERTIPPGGSAVIEKTVHTPEIPPRLDVVMIVDLSGSYWDDLPNIKAKAPEIFDRIRAVAADSTFGLATFVDYPFSPWGDAGATLPHEWAYRLDRDLTADRATWLASVNAMATRWGYDAPQSQYEALYQAASGAGRDVPPAGASRGDIAAGQAPGWRPPATKVVAITTDASFHSPADSNCGAPSPPCPFGYPGPSRNATVAALNAAGVKVIAIKAPGSGAQMDDVANATGGAVTSTGSSSAEIADAILSALGRIRVTVAMQTNCKAPINVSFAPASQIVESGEDAVFTETISVAGDAPSGVFECDDWATIDGAPMTDRSGAVIKEHKVVHVPDVTPPVAYCLETVNPHGQTVPPAGKTTPPGLKGGQNEDGFYQLTAKDNVDPSPKVFVTDTGSGMVFGPFASGVRIKYTEANGATPSQKKIGSTSGQAGAVDWHITGTGDAAGYAVDAAGNVSKPVACLVPPPPK